MKEQLADIREILSGAGLKATQQRMVVYQALLKTMNQHPTAERIFEVVRPQNPSISLGTVYKTLDTFVSNGLAGKVASDAGFMRYDINMEQHSHIYCSNTQEIIDYHDDELDQLIQRYFEKKNIRNLKIKNIHVQINGLKEDPAQEIEISN
ncbi:Fur family transcriptional regulator [Catalinimonas sp. 4WD22]|uniref:Fur family transcriptional regulator n=1 Tax=Catalinimonas locisalis TaxID=3133978 RepID=UPI0031014B9E